MSFPPRRARIAAATGLFLASSACSPAPEPHTAQPATPAQPAVTAQPTASATADSTAAPAAGPVPLVFEAKRIAGVHIGAAQPSIAFVGSGAFVVEIGAVAELCDLAGWKSLRSLPTGFSSWRSSGDGKLLAALDDEDTVLVDPETGDERGRLPTGAGTLSLSADGSHVVVVRTTAFDKFRGTVWSTAKGTTSPLRRLDGVQSVPGTTGALVAPDRAAFFAHSESPGPTLLVETQPPKRLDLEDPVRFDIAPDGAAAAVSGRKGDKVIVVVLDLPAGQERARFEVPPPKVKGGGDDSPPYVRALSVSKGASRVALAVGPAHGPGAVMVFDGRTGAQVASLETAPDTWLGAATLALSPDGKHLLWARDQKVETPAPAGAPPRPPPTEIAVAHLP